MLGLDVDEVEYRVNAYRTRATASVRARLNALRSLERPGDPRVVPLLLEVLGDRHEAEKVRSYVLKQLRNRDGVVAPADRRPVGDAIGEVMADNGPAELRLQAALALGEFTQIAGVLDRLGAICLAQDESIDLRYAAFTSLQRAGPIPECIALLHRISSDETLGSSTRGLLSAWRVE
jgi:hypothetical protein